METELHFFLWTVPLRSVISLINDREIDFFCSCFLINWSCFFFKILTFPCTLNIYLLTDTSNSAFDIVVCTQISAIPFQTQRKLHLGMEVCRWSVGSELINNASSSRWKSCSMPALVNYTLKVRFCSLNSLARKNTDANTECAQLHVLFKKQMFQDVIVRSES